MSRDIQNALLVLVTLGSVPLIISGGTYHYGLSLLGVSVFVALILIFLRQRADTRVDRLVVISWVALGLWISIPLTFLISMSGVNLFGSGLDGLGNWARFSLILGVLALVLTYVQLFRTSR